MTNAAIDRLRASSPDAIGLASLASIAARVDRGVLRTLRIELQSNSDATAEADLWFSDIVATRTANEIVLRTDVLGGLRDELVQSNRLMQARALIRGIHAAGSPLLTLEEELIYFGLAGTPVLEIERRLGEVIAAIREQPDRALDIAGWALIALPRLPARVRDTAAAWSLAFAAEIESGYAITLGPSPPRGVVLVDSRIPETSLGIAMDGDDLVLGVTEGASLQVPATTPRVVTVEVDNRDVVTSIDPGTVQRVPVGTSEVVLRNLHGRRWRVQTRPAPGPADHVIGAENGRWILVDGTDKFNLPNHQEPLAQALGEALAHAGFSLITLGRQGVSHVVARAFVTTLESKGYSSGIYRLLHIVPKDGSKPDFRGGGRALPAVGYSSVADAALARADLILSIGSSGLTTALATAARRAATPFASLLERTEDSPFELDPPNEWTFETTRLFIAKLIPQLYAFLLVQPEQLAIDGLLHAAAMALDQVDLDEYNRMLESIRQRAPEAVLPEVAEQLVVDPRRPSHRLLGYYALRKSLPFPLLFSALRTERETVHKFWETRTLWFALEEVMGVDWGRTPAEIRELAAVCASLQLELAANPGIDPGGECKDLLRRATPRNEWTARAAAMAGLASEYERVRTTMDAGESRTSKMRSVVHDIEQRFRVEAAVPEASLWFTSGASGQRIVALGLLLADPDGAGYWMVEDAIGHPHSPFEQYWALRVAQRLLGQLKPPELKQLANALEAQRSGPPGIITDADTSRRTLSDELLRQLSQLTGRV